MPLPLLVPLAIAGGAAVAKGIAGAVQTSKANKALRELNKTAAPEYSEDPRLTDAYNKANAMADRGFSGEEKSQFQQQLARNTNAMSRSANDLSGGNMGAAINSVLQANNTGAINEFAAKDAGLRRQNMSYAAGLAGAVQQQQNLIQQNRIARRTMREENYGKASAMGKENSFGALNDISNIAIAGMRTGKGAPSSDISGLQPDTTFVEEDITTDVYGNPL